MLHRAMLHRAMYETRPDTGAVVHLHATHSVAVSCLAGLDPADVLPPLTAYQAIRIGPLGLVPFHPPGSPALAEAVRETAVRHHALLLANHGPVVAGRSLAAAAQVAEELEQTARIYLLLRGLKTRPLTADQVADLNALFPS